MKNNLRKLILEDGTEVIGKGFGADREAVVELVFNTSMVGYQEILSDPSYTDQAVVMTYPLIGNYGMNDDDYETKIPTISGFVVRDYNDEPSNFRSSSSLAKVMEQYGIVGISDVDTRSLARRIRDIGSCKAMITDLETDTPQAVERLKAHKMPQDAVSRVSTKESYSLGNKDASD